MQESSSGLGLGYDRDEEIAELSASPEVVRAAIYVDELKEYLRQRDASLSSELQNLEKPNAADILFVQYLKYLSDKRYRYTLGPGVYFWNPGGAEVSKTSG
jgi:hypothetical protein